MADEARDPKLPPVQGEALAAAERAPARGSGRKRSAKVAEVAEPEPVHADAYVVHLPAFEGPLDLLLHLIQKHELDILDIPVHFVTEKYLEYLDVMRTLSIDLASEYLVMAATLLYIKSRSLLPDVSHGAGGPEDDEEAEDPRSELIRRLLEYQKYKAAAEVLTTRDALGRDVFARGDQEPVVEGPAPFREVGVAALLDAFQKVLERTTGKVEHQVVFDRISITDRIMELTERLRARRRMTFDELFEGVRTPFDLIITFLSVLEMCKMRLMHVYQADVLSPIHVELKVLEEDEESSFDEESGFGEEAAVGERDVETAAMAETYGVEPGPQSIEPEPQSTRAAEDLEAESLDVPIRDDVVRGSDVDATTVDE